MRDSAGPVDTRSVNDAHLQQEVIRELKWDSRVDGCDIGVTVDNGVVALAGTVTSFARKSAAQEAAHRVAGVLDVANDIVVTISGHKQRTDAEIAGAIREALDWDALIRTDNVRTTVERGWVTLEGSVVFLRERNDIESIVRRLDGVRGLTNKIVVNPEAVAPDVIRSMIGQALERRAEREASRIRVEVTEGVVTLSGRVRSWAEKRALLGTVSHARGVCAVNDNLFVDPMY